MVEFKRIFLIKVFPLFVFFILFVSLMLSTIPTVYSLKLGYDDESTPKVIIESKPVILGNQTLINTNSSNFLNTNLGPIGDFNATQFRRDGSFLSIIEDFITTNWCKLTGCSMTGDIDSSAFFNGQFNWTEAIGVTQSYFTFDGSSQTFDEQQLNDTIDDRTKSITYNASTITTDFGTLDSGNLASILVARDGNTYNVSEGTGANPLQITINFTDVLEFNTILIRELYAAGLGHEIAIGLWDYDTSSYEEEYGELTDMNEFGFSNIDVIDGSSHTNASGDVSLRFRHIQNGNPSHDFFLDYAVLVSGFSTIVTSEHDALAGRDDITNHPWAMDTAATRNITGNLELEKNLSVDGNVGIGTSSPGSPLEVVGSILAKETDDGGNAVILSAGASSGTVAVYNAGSATIVLAGATGSDSYINNGGNFGIGTSNPTNELSVNGEINVTDKIIIGGTSASPIGTMLHIAGNNPRMILEYPTNEVMGLVQGSDRTIWFIDNATLGLEFSAATTAEIKGDGFTRTPLMFIEAGGNVGIGTSSPLTPLQIDRDVAIGIDDYTKYQFGIHNPSDTNGEGAGIGFTVSSSPTLIGGGIQFRRAGSGSAGDLLFMTKATGGSISEKLRILGNGNVGIGTDSPSGELHLVGDGGTEVRFQSDGSVDAGVRLILQNDVRTYVITVEGSDGDKFKIKNDNFGVTPLTIEQNAKTNSLYLTSIGVGIGNTTPGHPLTVYGNSSVAGGSISIWAERNISATGFITRTSIFDKEKGNALDFIQDSDDYLTDGEIDHSKFYGSVSYDVIDFSKPVIEFYDVNNSNIEYINSTCEEISINQTLVIVGNYTVGNETFDETEIDGGEIIIEFPCIEELITWKTVEQNTTTYPETKKESGVDLGMEIDVLRQAIYEIKNWIVDLFTRVDKLEEENLLLKSELCKKDGTYAWC